MDELDRIGFQSSGTADESTTQTKLIPGLLTNSLRVVLKTFGSEIYQLTAHGSTTTTNQTAADNLREYGVGVEQRSSHAITIDYERLSDNDGEPINPLDEDAAHKVLNALDTHLGMEDIPVAPDLAVTSVTVRIDDERLAEDTRAQTSEFDLRFVADQSEDELLELTESINHDRGLYNHLGFNRTHLNLRSIVETATKYTTRTDGRLFNWHGPGDVRPRTSRKLARRVNAYVLPDEYSILKPYHIVDDHALKINEDLVDDILQGIGGGKQ